MASKRQGAVVGSRHGALGRRRTRVAERPAGRGGVLLPGVAYPLTGFKPENVGKPWAEPVDRVARVRCPLCDWSPPQGTLWYCISMGPPENFSGGCGHGWNTFDTRGQCPGCSYQWRHTWCFGCGSASPHDDWYDSGGGKP